MNSALNYSGVVIQSHASDKIVFIIDGNGGCGKDYLIQKLDYFGIRYINTSVIDPVKEILEGKIWDSKKDKKGRQLLHDAKEIFDKYNSFTTFKIIDKFNWFITSDIYKIMFIHCSDMEQTKLFKRIFSPVCPVVSIFIKSNGETCKNDPRYGSLDVSNMNDCELRNLYDYMFYNNISDNDKEQYSNYFLFAKKIYGIYESKCNLPYIINNGKCLVLNINNINSKENIISLHKEENEIPNITFFDIFNCISLYRNIDYIIKDRIKNDAIEISANLLIDRFIAEDKETLLQCNTDGDIDTINCIISAWKKKLGKEKVVIKYYFDDHTNYSENIKNIFCYVFKQQNIDIIPVFL